MKKVTKAVFPVGGMGTRFLPATKSIPKELLPIIDKPLIQYAVEEAIEAGMQTLIFITSASKHAISDHFDPMFDLRDKFVREGKADLAHKLDTLPLEVNRVFVPQGEPLGLGHAVAQARPLIEDDEHFAVLLADDFIVSSHNPTAELIRVSEQHGSASLLVEQVPPERIGSYGVIRPESWQGHTAQVRHLVEKPAPAEAPSDYGVIGRYVLPHAIFDHLPNAAPHNGAEIQLTDAIQRLAEAGQLTAVRLDGERYDCGSQQGFVMANIRTAMQDANLKALIQAEFGLTP